MSGPRERSGRAMRLLCSAPMPPFDYRSLPYAVPERIVTALRTDWERLASPGTWFTGADRVKIAAEVRRSRVGGAPTHELPAPTLEALRKIACAPATIRRDWVEGLAAAGLAEAGYVETIGVVARIVAVDAFHRGIGAVPEPLPASLPGDPTGIVDPAARPSKGYVSMARGTSSWWAISLVPDAFAGMEDFHNTLYLSPAEMMSDESPRLLTRTQIELVAARTSAINECFY
jgi:hypothetical protein